MDPEVFITGSIPHQEVAGQCATCQRQVEIEVDIAKLGVDVFFGGECFLFSIIRDLKVAAGLACGIDPHHCGAVLLDLKRSSATRVVEADPDAVQRASHCVASLLDV